VGFGWEEEVEPFFQQLWNIPQHPTKPLWVLKEMDRGQLPDRVRVPSKPPPALSPVLPGFCVVEEAVAEAVDMADRGRGRGRGSGRGEPWMQQQQMQ
jgi:hypothetical protein